MNISSPHLVALFPATRRTPRHCTSTALQIGFLGASILTCMLATGCGNDAGENADAEADIDPEIDLKVAEILQKYPDRYSEEDRETRDERAAKLRQEVVAMGPEAVDALVTHLDNKELRGPAMEVLAEFGPEARPAAPKLLEIIRTDESTISFDRLAANEALRKTGGDPMVLSKSLASENGNERLAALNGVKGLGKDILPLLPDLKNIFLDRDEDPRLRIETLDLLVVLGPDAEQLVAELTDLLKETDVYYDPRVRIDDKPAPIGGMAASAAKVLGSIGPKAKDALPALNALAEDEEEYNRKAAEDAIAKISEG